MAIIKSAEPKFAIRGVDGNYYPLPCEWTIQSFHDGLVNGSKQITLDVFDGILFNTVHGALTPEVALGNFKPSFMKYWVKKVIINQPATIVIWKDGTKTVCKCSEGDTFDPQVGIAMCFMKKMFGNPSQVRKFMKQWIKEDE